MTKKIIRKDKERSRIRTLLGVLKKRRVINGLTPEKLRLILEDMGPTYVKLGQIMSMRSDLLPEQYCEELQKLRTQARPVPFKEAKNVMEEEWGKPINSIFKSIDEEPLGSASIAQVYRAILKEKERQVVIKVRRPKIFDIMAKDVKLIHKAIRLLKIVGVTTDAINLGAVIDEMWTVARQEMNFLLEAEHLERFKSLNNNIAYVSVPYVYHNLTTSSVLVMERVGGIQIDEVDKLLEVGYDIHDIGVKLADNYSKQVLDDAFFHADPHPGNIRIEDGKIVFIDLGMVGTLSERDRVLIKDAITSLSSQDIHNLKDALLTLGTTTQKLDHSLLYSDLDSLVRKYLSLEMGEINLGKLVTDLLELASTHKIQMPSSITMLARGLITIEGVMAGLCPDINLLKIIIAHLTGGAFEKMNFSDEIKKLGVNGAAILKRSTEIPISFADLLKMGVKGEIKTNLEIVGSDEPLRKIDSMVTRLIVCIFASALLLGSSVICTTGMEPHIYGIPVIGALGFIAAVILGGWLTIDTAIIRKRRKKRK